MSVVFDMPFLS
jgi:hypothetical protein